MARRPRIRHSAEFKAEVLRRVRESEIPIRHLARELGITATTIHRWRQTETPAPARVVGDERTELAQLRREVHQLRQERDILKKVHTYTESGSSR